MAIKRKLPKMVTKVLKRNLQPNDTLSPSEKEELKERIWQAILTAQQQ